MKVHNLLTPVEVDILRQIAEGKSNSEIAQCLAEDTPTIEYRLGHMYLCYQVVSRAELIAEAQRDGCFAPPREED